MPQGPKPMTTGRTWGAAPAWTGGCHAMSGVALMCGWPANFASKAGSMAGSASATSTM